MKKCQKKAIQFFLPLFLLLTLPLFSLAQTLYQNITRFGSQSNNLISNGSFENHTPQSTGCVTLGGLPFCYLSPNMYRVDGHSIDGGWAITGSGISSGADIYSYSYAAPRTGSATTIGSVPDGTQAMYLGNSLCRLTNSGVIVPGNLFSIDADSKITWPAAPSFYQDIQTYQPSDCSGSAFITSNLVVQQPVVLTYNATNLIPGGQYHLEFWVTGESTDGSYPYDGAFNFQMSGATTLNQWLAVPSTGSLQMNGTTAPNSAMAFRYHVVFTAGSNNLSLVWTNYGHIIWFENSAWKATEEIVLDDVILTKVGFPLPVKLESFDVKTKNCNEANLNWTVSEAENFSRFEIERSEGTTGFRSIAVVNYRANQKTYSLQDALNTDGYYQYRLKLFDADGKYRYSPVVNVTANCGKSAVRVYPTVTATITNILGLSANQVIQVVSSHGQLMITKKVKSNAAEQVDVSGLAGGLYFIMIRDKNDVLIHQEKLIKQ